MAAIQKKAMKHIETIVSKLKEAAHAYYETDEPTMTDAEYDKLVEELQTISPNHPFLKEVGANPKSNVVKLPIPMASLDKRKPDTLRSDDLSKGPYVITDKLDGISALWINGYSKPPQLLLRGNGIEGQDVSHCISGIQGLIQCSGPLTIVRGELIVPKGEIIGTLARNWTNGVLHQKVPSKEDLKKIHFVAYQVCEPKTLTRSQQMTFLNSKGFEAAWSTIVPKLDVDILSKMFQERREISKYECDGLVVGQDIVPIIPSNASNPKDAFAFKMPTDDQRAETIVQEVEWASSRTGNWIPRVRFTPVKIGTANIEFCTGFHGQFIKDNSVGPGARIIVRRSGDVIPVLEKVLEPCPTGWQEPPKSSWKWDENNVHCIDTSEIASPDKLALEMEHQLVSLGIEGISKVTAKKLVEKNIKTIHDVLKSSKENIQGIIGKVNGEKLKDGLENALRTATTSQWVKAYLGWPKGFGDSRIQALLELSPNVSNWTSLETVPKGQSAKSLGEVQKVVPAYLEWLKQFPIVTQKPKITKPKPLSLVAPKGNYVMSGFRDADIQRNLEAAGWINQERVTKTTNVLIVPDDFKETTKVKAARDAGVRIIMRSQVQELL
jgi:DNA ligase (NAD+)